MQVFDDCDVLLGRFQRLQRAGELHESALAFHTPFMRIDTIREKQAAIPQRYFRCFLGSLSALSPGERRHSWNV